MVVACAALLVFLPLILLICLALRISGGDASTARLEAVRAESHLRSVKFRTMVRDAETGMAVYASAR